MTGLISTVLDSLMNPTLWWPVASMHGHSAPDEVVVMPAPLVRSSLALLDEFLGSLHWTSVCLKRPLRIKSQRGSQILAYFGQSSAHSQTGQMFVQKVQIPTKVVLETDTSAGKPIILEEVTDMAPASKSQQHVGSEVARPLSRLAACCQHPELKRS